MTRSIDDQDRERVQRSSVRVGLAVGVASAAVLGVIAAIIVATTIAASQPVPAQPAEGTHEGDHTPQRVVDVASVVPLVVILAALGVLALGVIAWWAARRAAAPMAQALRVQRTFVADASHELRTPLTTLTSRIQLASHRLERGGDVAGALAAMRRDAEVMTNVLTDLLLAADTSQPSPDSQASVAEVVSDAVGLLEPQADEREVTVRQEVEWNLGAVIDPVALTRAIVALMDNAIRHSPTGGTVVVEAHRAGSSIEVRVRDQGSGIPDGAAGRVFERFARVDDGAGTGRRFGLGLALVRDITARFGGSVRVERTSPSGTTFLVVLPAAGA